MKNSNDSSTATIRRGSGVYVFDDNSRVLLAQRGPSARHEQFKWEGVGGELEAGESFEQAAEREFIEELGIAVQLGKVIADFDEVTDSLGTVWEAKIFSGSITDTPHIPDPTKVAGFAWFTRDEVASLSRANMLADYSVKDFHKIGWL
jgi:8-oxo-dGTP pyrophosphatase MutT (NUDIX family)